MKERFFSSKNKIDRVYENDLGQLTTYKDVLRAFSRTTYSSLYVIDYEKQGFEYVSENP